jgi:hypothetical protein
MFIYDSMTQGLELLARRELKNAESLFLKIINDPYSQPEETKRARTYLNDIRACQTGSKNLDFSIYKKLIKKVTVNLDHVDNLLSDVYFSEVSSYQAIDHELSSKVHSLISRLKKIKISDITGRDKLFDRMEKSGLSCVKKNLREAKKKSGSGDFDFFRWKTIFRKFIEQINPVLLERHLELLDYILTTGEIQLLGDPKLPVLTPKYIWIIESTLESEWYLLRSYFFKAKSEIQSQLIKKRVRENTGRKLNIKK